MLRRDTSQPRGYDTLTDLLKDGSFLISSQGWRRASRHRRGPAYPPIDDVLHNNVRNKFTRRWRAAILPSRGVVQKKSVGEANNAQKSCGIGFSATASEEN
mmetsp:Transcript_25736/g.46634  ORF Transcript_25736/g.46634 Transcript_25736/m.46634 type:complete len:101 (+) Transcript_25736:821-1123(+)